MKISSERILRALTLHASESGCDLHCITISHRSLAKLAGYADTAPARQAMKTAEKHGLVVRVSTPGSRTTSVYALVRPGETVEEARQAGLALLAAGPALAVRSTPPKKAAAGVNPALLRAVIAAPGLSEREKLDALARLAA